MIKKLLLVLFLLVGCSGQKEPIELNQTVEIKYFYINGCRDCQDFKRKGIPYLKEIFQDQIVIHEYDLDDQQSIEPYDQVIDSLAYFDEEFYGTGPFLVVDDYFALLGYTLGDEEYIVKDIVSATKNELYCDELEGMRFYFQ